MEGNQKIEEIDFLKRPYSERQLIIVTDDKVVEAAREAELKAAEKEKGIDWAIIGEYAVKVLIGGIITEVTKQAIRAWSKARASGIQILQIGKAESKKINFPAGHPRDGVLYIGHPAIPDVYYTTAEFHRIIFEHKFCEAVNL